MLKLNRRVARENKHQEMKLRRRKKRREKTLATRIIR